MADLYAMESSLSDTKIQLKTTRDRLKEIEKLKERLGRFDSQVVRLNNGIQDSIEGVSEGFLPAVSLLGQLSAKKEPYPAAADGLLTRAADCIAREITKLEKKAVQLEKQKDRIKNDIFMERQRLQKAKQS